MKSNKAIKGFLLALSSAAMIAMASCAGGNSVSTTPSEPVSVTPSEVPSSTPSPVVDYGTLTIVDQTITFGNEVIINPVFSKEEYEDTVSYTFEGNNISIEQGKIKGLVPGTETTVTATTEHHSTTFKVTVNYVNGVLTNATGLESKFAVPTPEADKYVIHFKVDVEKFIDTYTRLSSFAFNGSDNSWYNMEMGADGNIHLFAKFNGHEKYWILLGNKTDFLQDGHIKYDVDILKNGQATFFYLNGELKCNFAAWELEGYAPLGAMEITAAADREGAGEYIVNLNNIYYEDENSDNFKNLLAAQFPTIADAKLKNDDGNEAKFVFPAAPENMLFKTTVRVNNEIGENTWLRTSAFAFNGTDNAWYNIEVNNDGNMHVFGHFNGVEKYWVWFGNKDSLRVEGKIQYDVAVLKRGQATYLFINDTLTCSFSEAEMVGFAGLSSFEVTACGNRDPRCPFDIDIINNSYNDENSEAYAKYLNIAYGTYDDIVLESVGPEAKGKFGGMATDMVFNANVVVEKAASDWMRPCAFAFNGSDNSWYNVEMGGDGNMTLYARFNGVEKYNIPLGNKTDYTNDGVFSFKVTILKEGQATYFMINDVVKASFTVAEMAGYGILCPLEVSACADRGGDDCSFKVKIVGAKVEDKNSESFAAAKAIVSAQEN